jgi:uncharacterized membrane protein YobD (UPF0266 family)
MCNILIPFRSHNNIIFLKGIYNLNHLILMKCCVTFKKHKIVFSCKGAFWYVMAHTEYSKINLFSLDKNDKNKNKLNLVPVQRQ